MRSFALALGSLAIATLFSAPALADCIPGTGVCAQVGVGVPVGNMGAQVQVGIPGYGQAPQAPQYAPPPPQDEPPAYRPRRRPAPAYYDEPAAPRRVRYHRPAQPNWSAEKLGLDVHAMGAAGFAPGASGGAYGLGGAGLGLRYRALPHLGFEGNLDLLGGRDYNDNRRFEVVGTLGGMIFLNPRSRAQLYLSGGFLLDHARASADSIAYPAYGGTYGSASKSYTHLGGYAGLGLEVFLSRRVSLHFDGRGVLRQNVLGGAPEFTDASTGRTTNTSAGFVGSGGMAFYF
jgi:hypothetical protein